MSHLSLGFDLLVDVPVPDLDPDGVLALATFVLGREGAEGDWTLCVVLTDDARLQALHRDFMGIDTPTDVMTFPLDDGQPGGDQATGGDVVISVERAAEQANDAGHATAEEVRFLIVHGLLHLCGWRDSADRDRQRMLDHQTALLAELAASAALGNASADRATQDVRGAE